MRISVLPDDPGYPAQGVFDVYLNGEYVRNCYTADDETGEVVVPDVSAAIETFGAVPMKTLRGKVSIESRIDGWYFD